MRSARSALVTAALLAGPLAFLGAFFAWPVVNLVLEGFRSERGWTASTAGEVLGDADLRRILAFTVLQAAGSTALTLALALPAAHVLARYEFRGRRAVQALAAVPFVLPTVVVGAAFLALAGPHGLLPVRLDGTVTVLLVAHAFFNHAVVVRTVGGVWEGLDPRLADAARVLGASPWTVWRTVTLPALGPAIRSAAVVVFLFCFTSFGIVRFLGGPDHATLEVEIYRQTAQLLDLPVASVLALVQLATVGLLLVVQDRLTRRVAPGTLAAPARRPVRSRRARLWVGGNLLVLGALLGAPLVALVERSLRTGTGYGLASWRALAEAGRGPGAGVAPWEAVGNSLRFAVVATVLAVVLGTLAAAALARGRGRGARAVDAVLLLPLGTSAVTVGFGFLVALDAPVDLRASPWLVPLAQAVVALPFVVRAVTPVLRAVDPRQREAAALLGAGPLRVWWDVDRRFAARALAVATGFAFAVSLGEFGATTMIARADRPTVPVAVARLFGRPGALAAGQGYALATVLLVLVAGAVLAVDGRRARGRSAPGWW